MNIKYFGINFTKYIQDVTENAKSLMTEIKEEQNRNKLCSWIRKQNVVIT